MIFHMSCYETKKNVSEINKAMQRLFIPVDLGLVTILTFTHLLYFLYHAAVQFH